MRRPTHESEGSTGSAKQAQVTPEQVCVVWRGDPRSVSSPPPYDLSDGPPHKLRLVSAAILCRPAPLSHEQQRAQRVVRSAAQGLTCDRRRGAGARCPRCVERHTQPRSGQVYGRIPAGGKASRTPRCARSTVAWLCTPASHQQRWARRGRTMSTSRVVYAPPTKGQAASMKHNNAATTRPGSLTADRTRSACQRTLCTSSGSVSWHPGNDDPGGPGSG